MKSFFVYMAVVLGAVSLLTALATHNDDLPPSKAPVAEAPIDRGQQLYNERMALYEKVGNAYIAAYCQKLADKPRAFLSTNELADLRRCGH